MRAKEVVEKWLDAVEARDAERIVDALADDVELRFEAMDRRPIVGKGALRMLLTNMPQAYDFIRVERVKIIESGSDVAALLHVQAKLKSDIELLGEKLPTAGKELSITGALFLTVDDAGKIAKMERVRDNLEVARQLGIPVERMQSLVEKMERRLAA